MTTRILSALFALFLLPSAWTPLAAQPEAPATEEEKLLYAMGMIVARNLSQLGFDAEELALVQQGMADALLGRETKVELQEYGPKIQQFVEQRMTARATAEKAESQAFVDGLAAEEGAVTTESGLVFREITAGSGASPAATDTVRVHYHGTLRDGTVFDSSVDRGEPVSFPLNRVIPCWTEGLQRMKVGGKSRLVCPSNIAYGDQGQPGIPGGAALVFEVELLGIEAPAPPAEGP